MKLTNEFDYIICGGGCAGLSLAMKLASPDWSDKRVLLIDAKEKSKNDRTWCSWVVHEDEYSEIQKAKWKNIYFRGPGFSKKIELDPYHYRMIRGVDFYKKAESVLSRSNHITRIIDHIHSIREEGDYVVVETEKASYQGKYAFKSFFDGSIDKKKYLYVDQHFKGFFIRTPQPIFDPKCATFMDFNIPQKNEIRFMYVLPEDKNTALVEVAIFSNEILTHGQYDAILTEYIEKNLQIKEYEILETEFGIIPMTNYPFYKHDTERIIHIGTAGGSVKPSSGFAFMRIQEHTDLIVDCLRRNIHPSKAQKLFKPIFKLMDSTLLDVFLLQKKSGAEIFAQFFKGNSVSQVFKFLDEKTEALDTLKIISKLDWPPFIKGFFRQLLAGNYR